VGAVGRPHIANHPPMIGHMRVDGQFQISLERGGMRRATALPLTAHDIAQLALAAAVRNVGMTQLLTEVVTTAIKKGMIEEILREPAQERAPPFQPENS
jgi:predicted TIM-barrel enzyme